MQVTKHDLSYDEVKLDYQALLRTSVIAFARTRNEIERLVNHTHSLTEKNFSSTARCIYDEAEKLVVAAETWHALEEGLTRRHLEVINKPDIEGGN